jgi:parallel beta-helix repeat protein
MTNFLHKSIYLLLFITVLVTSNTTFAQSNNNAYVFDDESGYAEILDDEVIEDQEAFQYFDNPAYTNDSISVEAWVYLIGENPGVKMPIINRSFDDGYESFSLYIEDRIAYFSIGNGIGQVSTIDAAPIPAFSWVHLVGTFDGENLKIYYGGDLVQTISASLGNGHGSGQGGLYIGKSDEGSFKGLMDEVRIWRIALEDKNINGSGGNGNPSENFPQSIAEYLNGRWSFTEFSDFNGIKSLEDLSDYDNHLNVYNIDEIVNSKQLPFIVVNSTGDAPDLLPGDGKADAGNGLVTLRSAIEETNALPGYQIIYFYIPGSVPHIIQPGSALPGITDQVYLNATLQSGYTGSPLVETSGTYGGLSMSGGASTVNGLTMNSSSGYGLTLSTAGGNTIEVNQIAGISINSSDNYINDNTITNSVADGISITVGAGNNLIGVSSPNTIFENNGYGISVVSANGNQITDNTITSNSSGGVSITNSTINLARNTVSGNSIFGILLNSTNNNTLTQNEIAGNLGDGLVINGNNNDVNENTIVDNDSIGLSITAGTGNQITDNTFELNGLGGISISNSTKFDFWYIIKYRR